jgi:hypothetical protein
MLVNLNSQRSGRSNADHVIDLKNNGLLNCLPSEFRFQDWYTS